MARFVFLAALLCFLGRTASALAGSPRGQALDESDVFVATITRVEDTGATNTNPPRVWLKVDEVLHGKQQTHRSPATWLPQPHDIDTSPEEPRLSEWKAQPLKGPRVGEKWILLGAEVLDVSGPMKATKYEISSYVRIPFNDKARDQIIKQLKALEVARQ
jgi:hypothetical protein